MFLELVYEKNVEKFELWATTALECCKQSLMGDFGKTLEEQNAGIGRKSLQ